MSLAISSISTLLSLASKALKAQTTDAKAHGAAAVSVSGAAVAPAVTGATGSLGLVSGRDLVSAMEARTSASAVAAPQDIGAAGADAAWRSVKAHTTFKVNGKIEAMVFRDGVTITSNNVPRDLFGGPDEEGLEGMELADLRKEKLAKYFGQKYGDAVTIEDYRFAADAPTRGFYIDLMEEDPELFGGGFGRSDSET